MITRIEALGYRCLRYVSQPLGPFHVLVGPNASGKTTFLDVIAFLGRLVSDGPDAAIEERSQNFYDLVWRRKGRRFELAIEAKIPDELRKLLIKQDATVVRYEVAIGLDSRTDERSVLAERVLLKKAEPPRYQSRLFPAIVNETLDTLIERQSRQQVHISLYRSGTTGASFNTETLVGDLKAWKQTSRKMLRRTALRSLAVDEDLFPVTYWLGELVSAGSRQFVLSTPQLRNASPPGLGKGLRPDGSNLPWVVADLRQRFPDRFKQWIAHLQTAFPDLQDIKTVERPEDRHRYLMLQYGEGLEIPSWMASDGTLRMLALTLPAYLEDFKGIYLIEEPENGIHPRAIETMTQSLSSVYNAQVLMATHSPVILSTVEAEQILCFAKTREGATDIIRGSEHPALRSWKHETTLGTLFAAGVLG